MTFTNHQHLKFYLQVPLAQLRYVLPQVCLSPMGTLVMILERSQKPWALWQVRCQEASWSSCGWWLGTWFLAYRFQLECLLGKDTEWQGLLPTVLNIAPSAMSAEPVYLWHPFWEERTRRTLSSSSAQPRKAILLLKFGHEFRLIITCFKFSTENTVLKINIFSDWNSLWHFQSLDSRRNSIIISAVRSRLTFDDHKFNI